MDDLTLESVKANFAHWRLARKKKARIPPELWEQALNLLGKYKKTNIVKTLSLEYTTFSKKIQERNSKQALSHSGFVEISIPSEIIGQDQTKPTNTITITRTDGAIFSVENLQQNLMLNVLNQFMEGT